MLDISRRYVKSIFESKLDENFMLEILDNIDNALNNADFSNTILSPNVTKEIKEDLLLSLVDSKDKLVINFLKLLVEKNRIEVIPSIKKELSKEIALRNNEFDGYIYSKDIIDNSKIEEIYQILSKKFNSKINLIYEKNNYDGILVNIEYLGVEIGFSWDRLKQSLEDHILKAI